MANNMNTQINKKEYAYKLLEIINNWISNFDTKASFALAFLTFILTNTISKINIQTISNISTNENIHIILKITIISTIVCLYLFNINTLIFLILTIKPRLKNNISPRNKSSFYFKDISSFSETNFRQHFKQLNNNKVLEEIIKQIHTNSIICTKKAENYNIAINSLICTIILWFIVIFFNII